MESIPTLTDIKNAYRKIKPYIHHTPVLTSRQLNDRFDGQFFFKCENFQKVGAFKFRGACHTVFALTEQKAKPGVATHSSGNHAQAIALAAKLRGIPAYIVMPENAPRVKKEAVAGYGAKIRYCAPTLKARENTLEEVVKETGAVFIHPYNDARIIAGQGTVALELLNDYPELDTILAPIGGGGLAGGTAIAVKNMNPGTEVIGVEPERADDAYRSLKSGELIRINDPDTIADGLRTSLGQLTYDSIRKYIDDIVTVQESTLIAAMKLIWERMKIIIEPSSAAPVAAVMEGKVETQNRKTGIIITGGNVDLDNLPWYKLTSAHKEWKLES